MSFIRSKDAVLYYEEYGSGEPLILLPGLMGTIETDWRRFIPDLARHFHVVAVDLRGHGKTNNPSGELRLQTFVDDLSAIVETLQLDAVHVCGYSLGGYIGLAFGIRHQGRVRSVIMHATKFYWSRETIAETLKRLDPETMDATGPDHVQALQVRHSPGNGEEGWRTLVRASSEFMKRIPDEGLTEASLRLAQFPILVTRGEDDRIVRNGEAARIITKLPQGRLEEIQHAAHPIATLPKEPFLSTLLTFLHFQSSANIAEDLS